MCCPPRFPVSSCCSFDGAASCPQYHSPSIIPDIVHRDSILSRCETRGVRGKASGGRWFLSDGSPLPTCGDDENNRWCLKPYILNLTRKCNSRSWLSGSAAIASWLYLTDQSKRSTHERLHTADPRTTVSNSCLIENGAHPNSHCHGRGSASSHDQSKTPPEPGLPGLAASPSPLPGPSPASHQKAHAPSPDSLARGGDVVTAGLES